MLATGFVPSLVALATLVTSGVQCQYFVVYRIPPETCGSWFPPPLNARGFTVGDFWVGCREHCVSGGGWTVPLRWTPGGGLDHLPLPAGIPSAKAEAVNASGMIVGSCQEPDVGFVACIWKDGEFIQVPPMGGDPPYAEFLAVNDAGTAVGWRTSNGYQRGMVWHDGRVAEIDPTPFGYVYSYARSITSNGWISGTVGNDLTCNSRAFRMRDGVIELLEPLPGCVASQGIPRGVTSRGWVLGYSALSTGTPCGPLTVRFLYTLWTEHGVTEVQALPGYSRPIVRAINDKGVMIGDSREPTAPGLQNAKPTIWINGEPLPLVDLYCGNGWPTSGVGPIALLNSGDLLISGPVVVPGWTGSQTLWQGIWIAKPFFSSEADVNGDCRVDGLDLAALFGDWGSDVPVTDLNHDGIVNADDLAIMLASWMPIAPEPPADAGR